VWGSRPAHGASIAEWRLLDGCGKISFLTMPLKSAIENALELKQLISESVSPAIATTIGEFVAANPANIPAPLRPYQAAYRRVCDIHAATGLGAVGGADIVLNPACGDYLGADLPTYQGGQPPFVGGQCPAQYDVEIIVQDTRNGVLQSPDNKGFNNVQGPIGGASIVPTGPRSYNVVLQTGTGPVSRGYTSSNADTFTGAIQSITPQIDSGVDNCGDPPAPPGSYPPTRPPGQRPPSDFTFDDGSGPPVQISVGNVSIDAQGTLSIPVDVGGIDLDFGGGTPGGENDTPPVRRPDLDNPGQPIRPGDPNQPEDGVEEMQPVICFQVFVTQEPPNKSVEVGGEEDIFIEGQASDAGWARFIIGTGTTEPIRILSRSNMFCYCCSDKVVPNGIQVKFSYGFSGFVVLFPVIEE